MSTLVSKATYLGQYVRPRSVTRPPPSASDLHLRLGDLEYRDPTTFTSTQKMHYLPQDVTGRTQPVLPVSINLARSRSRVSVK